MVKITVKDLLIKQVEEYGVLRLAPTWVPRAFCRPGKRIKLHPDDYYALGLKRGGIDERWFASATKADNGPGTPEDEGLSYIIFDNGEKMLLCDAIALMGSDILGSDIWDKFVCWPMFSKFFDNAGPLPHHVHHREEHARLVGQMGKPEMYFFPSQLNNHPGEFPFTFFGFNPETTREQVKSALMNFTKGDNKLLGLSRAYKLELDTGWDVPPGILHAPGSLCTYEPQAASDVYAMYQSILYGGHAVPAELLWKNCPEDKLGNYDYLMEVIDWKENIDPDFSQKHFMKPIPAGIPEEMEKEGYHEEWICYKTREVSAKRLIIKSGCEVTIRDAAPYGFICLQGMGEINGLPLESPTIIRYGQHTYDEYFVTSKAANAGVSFVNKSKEDIVLLKHFSLNPDLDEVMG